MRWINPEKPNHPGNATVTPKGRGMIGDDHDSMHGLRDMTGGHKRAVFVPNTYATSVVAPVKIVLKV
jgi:hypothetical protein